MKVLFYSPLAALSYHFETDLELIKLHQDKGDDVYVIGCNGQLKKVGYFGCQGFLRCMMCKSKWDQGINLLNLPKSNYEKVNFDLHHSNWIYESADELKSITYKGVDIGAAVLSTLISNVRESNPVIAAYKKQIDEMLNNMVGLCDSMESYLTEIAPDIVYFFNGRFSLYRPILRICQQKRIKFFVHERGGSLHRYSLTENTYPHDLDKKKEEISSLWNNYPLSQEQKIQNACEWYELRRGGYGQSWYSFTEKQKIGLLPSNFNNLKRNIGIFISSEDEFAVIQGWENPYFSNQFDGIFFILKNFKDKNDFHFYVRIHPNLKGLKNSQINDLNSLQFKNVTIIQADDPINTYYLMDQCEKIVTFGSTVGAESVYAGKPSILVGRTFYEDMAGIIKPTDREDLLRLIEMRINPPERDGILAYGLWAKTFGIPFKYFNPTNLSNGFFLGQKITGNKSLAFFAYFFAFFLNLKFVLRGQMSWGFVWNRIKNKITFLR